jgi:6-phospho-beta-glucosidase
VKCAALTYALAGLNHQSWLYAFKDSGGFDRTSEILGAIHDNDLVSVDSHVIADQGAVPMPYLRLYLHSSRELARQRAAPRTRGEELIQWSQRLNGLLKDPTEGNFRQALSLISLRKPDWYKDGVIPVLEALTSPSDTVVSLNVRNQGAIADISENAIVETMCLVRSGTAKPLGVPPLPPKPALLTRQLVDYEQAVLALPSVPSVLELEEVLSMHPLVPREGIRKLARSIQGCM